MAKGYDKGRARRGSEMQFLPSPDAQLAQKLAEVVSDLYMSTNESDIRRSWTSAHRLLLKSKADPPRIEAVMKARRVGALATLVKELEQMSKSGLRRSPPLPSSAPEASSPAAQSSSGGIDRAQTIADSEINKQAPASSAASPAPPSAPPSAPQSKSPSPEALKSAMKSFRKRLKLTKLDDESRLGNRAVTGGKQSQIVAILPPREYPPAVWEELVKQGKLINAGSGFYQIAGE